MTLWQATLAAAERALLAALLAWLLAWLLALLLRRPLGSGVGGGVGGGTASGTGSGAGGHAGRALLVLAAAAVLLMPRLLVGYAWVGVCARLGVVPEAGGTTFALLHAVLLGLGSCPLAAAVLLLVPPPPLTDAALHGARLMMAGGRARASRWRRWRLYAWSLLHGERRRHLLALGAGFLVAFQDFELASLLRAPSWTVWLFDAQAGGQALGVTLAQASLPASLELLLLGALALLLARSGGASATLAAAPTAAPPAPANARVTLLACGALALAFAAVVVLPAAWVTRDLAAGLDAVAANGLLQREMALSLAVAALAAALAVTAALWLRRAPTWLAALLVVPGLCGGLVLGLGLQALFQLPPLQLAYDTVAPLLLGLALLLLPAAVLLQRVLEPRAADPALHAAALLEPGTARQRRAALALWLVLRGRRRAVLAALLLGCIAFEVTTSALLAPVAITPVAVRLYNLMHYGHSPALSAMAAAAMLALLATAALVAGGWAMLERRVQHA